MKKFLMLAALGTAACCLGACSCSKDKSSGPDGYEQLNSMLAMSYSSISLTVTDTFSDGLSLKSEYVINYSESEITVEYSVERFTEISLDAPSDGVKTTLEGTAVIKGGVVTGGEEAGITANMASPIFNFKEAYFENATLTGAFFTADVKSTSSFLGFALSCTDMKVRCEFLEFFYSIEISYTKDGNRVEYEYIFKI